MVFCPSASAPDYGYDPPRGMCDEDTRERLQRASEFPSELTLEYFPPEGEQRIGLGTPE
jgi:hypothetical protein